MNPPTDVHSTPDLLIPAKISLPHHQIGIIRRKHLSEILEGVFTHRLTLVCAPAGYGKTTLVSDWVANQSSPVAWLSLTQEDNHVPVFLTYLSAALKKANPAFGNCIEEVLHQGQAIHLPSLIAPLMQELDRVTPAMLLVLDDFHLIHNPQLHELIQFLLQNCLGWTKPDGKGHGCRLILISRTAPPFPLSKWRLHQELIEIGIDELKFSLEETEEYIKRANRLDLQPARIDRLAVQTEGWVTGLQLSLLDMKAHAAQPSLLDGSEIHASNQFLVDYLMEEVIQNLPEDIRLFLLQTSILEHMTADLCDQIRGKRDSQQILEWLNHENLFILPMDNQQGWYRYHQLFLDVLVHRQSLLGKETLQDYHNKAARWLEEKGFIRESLGHWLAAENTDDASRMLTEKAPSFLNTSQSIVLRELLEALPEKCFSKNPWLCIYHAWAYAIFMESRLSHRLDQAMEIISTGQSNQKFSEAEIREIQGNVYTIQALHEARLGGDQNTIDLATTALSLLPPHAVNVRGLAHIAIGKIRLRNGELDQAIDDFSEARIILQQGENISGVAETLYLTAEIHRMHGKLKAAHQVNEEAVSISFPQHSFELFFGHLSNSGLGLIELEWGHPEQAEDYIQRSYARIGSMGVLNRVRIGLARLELYLSLHMLDEAGEVVKNLEPYLENRMLSRFSRNDLNGYLLRYYSAHRDFQIARQIIHANQIESITPGDFRRENELIGLAYFYWMGGLWDQLIELLEKLLPILKSNNRYDRSIRLETLYAVALFQMGDQQNAVQHFLTALDEGLREGYFWTYVSVGEPIIELINAVFNKMDHHPEYSNMDASKLKKISETISQWINRKNDQEKIIQNGKMVQMIQTELIENPLTVKERQLLKYLAGESDYKMIAKELRLSITTIRTHVYHIFGKLGVHSRMEAIIKAKELKLF